MFFLVARQARSKDPTARTRAAQKLGAGGRQASPGESVQRNVALLLELARDVNGEVRAAAYESLGQVADRRALDAMLTGLKDVEKLGEPAATAVRESAARAFERMGAEGGPALVQLARDKNPKLRETAVAALGSVGGAEAEAALVAALQDSRSGVRQAAVRALARGASSSGSLASLAAALAHKDPATRKTAIEVVAEVKGAEAARALQRLTRDADRGVREAAVHGLAKQGSPEAIDALLAVFEGQDRELRTLAAAALKGADWQPATPAQRAFNAILHGDYSGAAAHGQAAVEPLAALLADKSPAVRAGATEALGRTSHESAVKPLLASLQDSDEGVRQAAADALVRIGQAAVVPLASAVHESVRAAAPDIVLRMQAAALSPLLDLLEQGEAFTHDGRDVRRLAVDEDEDAERAARAALLLKRLLGQPARDLDATALGRVSRLRDIVRMREVMPASRRESPTTVVETLVDCEELRTRARSLVQGD